MTEHDIMHTALGIILGFVVFMVLMSINTRNTVVRIEEQTIQIDKHLKKNCQVHQTVNYFTKEGRHEHPTTDAHAWPQ